jgi:hypothetical protein
MLCAFTARPIVELRQRDKSKIEATLAYGTPVTAKSSHRCIRLVKLTLDLDCKAIASM